MAHHLEKIRITNELINQCLAQDGTVYLDSSDNKSAQSKFSILGVNPFVSLIVKDHRTQLNYRSGERRYLDKDPFEWIGYETQAVSVCLDVETPFKGGFIGSLSYESAKYFKDYLASLKQGDFPEILGGIYDRFFVINHQTNETTFISLDIYENPICFNELKSSFKNHNIAFHIEDSVSFPIKRHYLEQVNTIKSYIRQGHTYQVNYSVPFQFKYEGCLVDAYSCLREISPAPYAGYLSMGPYCILSASPELFIEVKDDDIVTKPIKGTSRRGSTIDEDNKLKKKLNESTKDHAELLMIIDLERNDLNRICKTNTVKVKKLREIETFQQVFHGVSTIKGTLKEGMTFKKIMEALFPGGSITGAPKIRAMEIINETEISPRGPYTGCLGFVSFGGDMAFNISIRTIYSHQNKVTFHAGGGIVSDSIDESEWEECLIKVSGILKMISKYVKV